MAEYTFTSTNVDPDDYDEPGAQFGNGTAGAAITAGQAVYLDSGDSTIKLAIATSSAAAAAKGIALNDAATGQRVHYIAAGLLDMGTITGATDGDIVVVSQTTAGSMRPSADLVSTNYPTILGWVTNGATQIQVKIVKTGELKD